MQSHTGPKFPPLTIAGLDVPVEVSFHSLSPSGRQLYEHAPMHPRTQVQTQRRAHKHTHTHTHKHTHIHTHTHTSTRELTRTLQVKYVQTFPLPSADVLTREGLSFSVSPDLYPEMKDVGVSCTVCMSVSVPLSLSLSLPPSLPPSLSLSLSLSISLSACVCARACVSIDVSRLMAVCVTLRENTSNTRISL